MNILFLFIYDFEPYYYFFSIDSLPETDNFSKKLKDILLNNYDKRFLVTSEMYLAAYLSPLTRNLILIRDRKEEIKAFAILKIRQYGFDDESAPASPPATQPCSSASISANSSQSSTHVFNQQRYSFPSLSPHVKARFL